MPLAPPPAPNAARGYATAAARRSPREAEADVFRRANGALRAARSDPVKSDPGLHVRAVADNFRLWLLVGDLLRDPANALPEPLRAQIVSVAHAVQREIGQADPDLDFLIGINENIAAGLSGTA